MRRQLLIILLLAVFAAVALTPLAGPAAEDAPYLSGQDLKVLEPAFDAFVEALADRLIELGLLASEEREAWVQYQRGDFLQNGGYGTIAVLYAPGLLSVADESIAMRTMYTGIDIGTVKLDTLQRYVPDKSSLPGMPLDVEVLDDAGMAIACRFRWVASYGSLYLWDGSAGDVVDAGATVIHDGRPMYWYAEPVDGIRETLTLELLATDEDRSLAVLSLKMVSGPDGWTIEGIQ